MIREQLKDYLNSISLGDSLDRLKELPDSSVDLVVMSPPYNLRNSSRRGKAANSGGKWKKAVIADAGYDGHDDNMPHEEYVSWQREILTECMRVIKPNGAIYYNHKDRIQNGLLQTRNDILEGFPVRQRITWFRNGGHNFNPGYYVPMSEQIYLICNKGFRLAKGGNKYGDVWQIAQAKNSKHPAPMPVELAERCISTTNARVVLDPFMGSGTTAIAARRMGRYWIGFEKSREYIDMAQKRLQHEFETPQWKKWFQALRNSAA